jgi:phosphoglycolate phosphatase
MTSERAPFAALDDILTRTAYLLIDFDGPVCSLFAGTNTTLIADRLRKTIMQDDICLPQAVEDTSNWFEILAFAASVRPELAARVEAELTRHELAAVSTARPTAYIGDALSACRETGRSAAVVSNNSGTSVHAYLEAHGLSDHFKAVATRTGYDPAVLKPSPHLVHQAVNALGATSAACTVVGDAESDMKAAVAAGAQSIGYANKPTMRERLTAAGAGTIITSLADLTLRLRARPIRP